MPESLRFPRGVVGQSILTLVMTIAKIIHAHLLKYGHNVQLYI